MSEKPAVGTIGWVDLTVEDAGGLRDFYEKVVGWSSDGVDMGEYEDFSMISSETGSPVAGVCHARGPNLGIPPVWIMYVIVADLDRSVEAVESEGGSVVVGPKSMGAARYCIIRDPAGAHIGLYQP